MKTYHILFFVAILGLSSCNWGIPDKQKPAITTDTLTYTYQTIKQRATDCGNKPDSECTVVKIKYPVFSGQKTLNDTIRRKFLKMFYLNDGKDTTLNQLTTNFIRSYDENKGKYGRNLYYTLNIHASVARQDSSLTTLDLEGYAYEGGAHGGAQSIFINWNTKVSKNIRLSDILIEGYPDKLNQIAERLFRKQEKLSDTATLANDYFFGNNKFSLNNNFLITPLGIRFLYNEYEIKPYAAGTTDLFIPYAQIKSLLRPNTVITQYIK